MKKIQKIILFTLAAILSLQTPIVLADDLGEEDQKSYINGSPFYDPFFVAGCGDDAPIQGVGVATNDIKGFVDAYGQAAFDIGKQYGIPYDAILAQAALESGYGKSELTRKANNFFGMKAGPNWNGPTIAMRTAEQDSSGNESNLTDVFRAYPTPQEGFKGYGEFIRGNQRYKSALNHPNDPVKYIQAIKDAGYATDINYVSKVVNILQGVQTYIKEKGAFPPSSEVVPDTAPPSGIDSSQCQAAAGAGGPVADIAIREAQQWKWAPGAFKKYTQGRAEDWCADFVSWVYNEGKRPLSSPPNLGQAGGWQIPSVSNMKVYLENKGTYWQKNDPNAQAPQPGDIVIRKNGESHTNIVVWSNGFMVKTVGGNEGQSAGSQGSYFEKSGVRMSDAPYDIRSQSGVSGWGRLP